MTLDPTILRMRCNATATRDAAPLYMRCSFVLLLLVGCSNSLRSKTHSFVADTPCGQGPYDIHLKADGMTGEEGLEVIACSAHALRGTAEFTIGHIPMQSTKFGDDVPVDNGRCLARPIGPATAGNASGNATSAADGGTPAGATRAAPVLVERPYSGSESPFADELCKQYGLPAQTLMIPTLTRTEPGDDLHLRLWSDAPNDLEGAVFLVRQMTSKKSKAEMDKEWEKEAAKREREAAKHPHRDPPRREEPRVPQHGPPPAPLAEARPQQPAVTATWIAGYWQWTGTQWGWVAGFWRDDRLAMPAPRIEVPGAPPGETAVWVGGVWTLRAGAWIWIGGHWR
jgi:hypothetical protein